MHAPDSTYSPGPVPCWELVWMVEGRAVATVDGDDVTLVPGTALLIHPGDDVSYRWGGDTVVRQGFVVFATAPAGMPEWPRLLELADRDIVRPLLDHVLWLEAERPAEWWSAVAQAFEYALRAIVAGYAIAGRRSEPALPDAIVLSIRFLARRWAAARELSGASLTELAGAAGVTPEHLCRVYAHELGVGPVAVVRLLRLNRAALLLAQSTLSISEVARRTGFASQYHFSKVFKTAAGATPSEFRADRSRSFDLPEPIGRLTSYLTAD